MYALSQQGFQSNWLQSQQSLILYGTAMSNWNAFLGQKLSHSLNEGRTLNDLLWKSASAHCKRDRVALRNTAFQKRQIWGQVVIILYIHNNETFNWTAVRGLDTAGIAKLT